MATSKLPATRILLVAIVVGLIASSLLYRAELGLNVALSSLIATATVLLLERHSPTKLTPAAKALLLTASGFGLLFAFRDSPALQFANGFALLIALGSSLYFARRDLQWNSSFSRIVFYPLGYLFKTFGQFVQLISQHQKERPSNPEKTETFGRVFLGATVATPLLLVFGGLFYSADAMFRNRIDQITTLSFDPTDILGFSFLAAILIWVGGGALYRFVIEPTDYANEYSSEFIGPTSYSKSIQPPNKRVLGHIEHTTILTSLVTLFAIFIAIQFESFFGGARTVASTTGLTFAEYARSGFFQLVWVAALALITIISLDSIQKTRNTTITWLTRALVSLVFLVIASAGMRMKLYTSAFGLTELRLYTSAFMVWIALAFAWLIPTVTAGRAKRFGFGAVLAGFGVIATLNFLNPDALIVRTNLAMSNPDLNYMASLSQDAKVAWNSAPNLNQNQRDILNKINVETYGPTPTDWRSLNLSEILNRK